MDKIWYIERETGEKKEEKVFGDWAIQLLYGDGRWNRLVRGMALGPVCRLPFFSKMYGWWQRQRWTKRKIERFIEAYGVDRRESLLRPDEFASFDAFFSRELKPSVRPVAKGTGVAVMPADGRYWVYPNLANTGGFFGVKGKTFSLERLLGNGELAKRYEKGVGVFGRLCPSDYHRFHFPCSGVPDEASLINGALYSVNPLAVRHNLEIYCENKRYLTKLQTAEFGEVLLLEIGATNVGTVHQTYAPGIEVDKGEEKGYFSFGGSAVVVLFLPGKLKLESDLVDASRQGYEIRCLMGQPLGKATVGC